MGAIGWPAKKRLYTDAVTPVHGYYDMDPPHRRHNNVGLAITDASAGWAKNEIQTNQGLSSAPFGGAAHHQCFKASGTQFFNIFGPKSDVFLHFDPRIVFQLCKGRIPDAYGTDDHIRWTSPSQSSTGFRVLLDCRRPPLVNCS